MQNLVQPTLLLKPFAENGDKNDIPLNNETIAQPQLADLTVGFPPITSKDPADGGLPPERKDFNALGYLTTTYDYFYQAGGTFTFNSTISNAIGGYPLNARLWYTDSNGISCILRSTIANNTNDFTQDDSVIGETGSGKPWEIENFRGISSRGVLFDCKWSDHIINDISWLRADTFSWQSGAVYVSAYNHLVDEFLSGQLGQSETIAGITIYYNLAPDGHKIIDASYPQEVQHAEDIYNATGVAWYYILDTANQRFKLPRTKYAFTGVRDTVGKYVPAGLPNITGTHDGLQYPSIWTEAFYDMGASNTKGTGADSYGRKVGFDASRVNSIYGNSTTVQPPATQMYLYFYVGQFTQSATEQTAGLNSELFNGKVDLNAANLSDSGKSLISGLGMPSDNYDNLTLGTTGTQYTAPANGYFIINYGPDVPALRYFRMINITKGYSVTSISGSVTFRIDLIIPVLKGDIMQCDYNATGTIEVFRFYYAEGENNV